MNKFIDIGSLFKLDKPNLLKFGVVHPKYYTDRDKLDLLLMAKKASFGKGFMKRYFYMMRLLDCLLANEGYQLDDQSPHSSAGRVLLQLFPEKGTGVTRFGRTRNALKYNQLQPEGLTIEILDFVIEQMELFVLHANTLQRTP